MTKHKGRGGLGKGLSALIPQEAPEQESEQSQSELPLEQITANPYQPRRTFDPDKLRELTESIQEHGVVQPVLVRQLGPEAFELVAGERRYRAASAAGLKTIPAVIKELNDQQMMEIALIENIQRQDLNPVEEAKAYKKLNEEFHLTQEEIGQRVSKSRSFVANTLRLLNLPEGVLDYLAQGILTTGHVRPLLVLPEGHAKNLADKMVREKATVREAEAWTKSLSAVLEGIENGKKPQKTVKKPTLTTELKAIQNVLREKTQTKVEIAQGPKGGKIIIDYYTQDDLERILSLMTGQPTIE